MRGIKIPLQDFALNAEGAYARGGHICGTLRYINPLSRNLNWLINTHPYL